MKISRHLVPDVLSDKSVLKTSRRTGLRYKASKEANDNDGNNTNTTDGRTYT